VNFWEFLDRRSERKSKRGPLFRFDTQTLIGFGFLAGYYILVYRFTTGDVPPRNVALIRDAMLTLGPPVGLIVGAIFRESLRDRQSTANTAAAFRAVEAAAAAGTSQPQPDVTLQPGDTAQAAPAT
jgi:hypothetical protein